MTDERPESRVFQLDRGDSLLLVTDGLGEALSRDYPEDALLELLGALHQPNSALLGELNQTAVATALSKNVELDDRTAVLLTLNAANEL